MRSIANPSIISRQARLAISLSRSRPRIPIYSYNYVPSAVRFASNPGEPQSGLLDDQGKDDGGNDSGPTMKTTLMRMFESAATTFASIFILG